MKTATAGIAFLLALGATTVAAPASAQGVLNVYCSVQVEWCTLLANEFQKATGVKVSMTQKGSGETIAQLKAEAQNPKGMAQPIIFRTDAGTFTYRVTRTQVVNWDAVWIVDQHPGRTVTLFACHPPGSAEFRYVVFGELVTT